MIVLFTDFGAAGPYTGQMHGVLAAEAPGVPLVDLMTDAPRFNPRASAYLLAAYAPVFPRGSVFLCVVDPGVGTSSRLPVMVWADGRWYVGPDNGLLHVVARQAAERRRLEILWRPDRISGSFHGRDLFAPAAALLASGAMPENRELPWSEGAFDAWPLDLPEIIYLDPFGNAVTGIRAGGLRKGSQLRTNGYQFVRAKTFGDVASGQGFWYENANGLVEIAVNQGSAAQAYGLTVGTGVNVVARE